MDKIPYEELIKGINNGDIEEVHFSVMTYSHYRSCYLRRAYIFSPSLNKYVFSHIELVLTEDKSEWTKYARDFTDRHSVFVIKGKGKFTLKEIYKNIEILSIKYAEK